ncbi:hypothetical protein HJG54_18135 [Leptolyngbya sp. NK1-12]|uniref:Uncharacterized protein n=1 Tax=Leptolyngbya sp. NK1-12 TaxID=2547451 RepID=A0AA96WVR4_9CYAN|nr:hypothetical protein [Leptolyngbya sp. NK1-12]WNZ24582.1 hypothetical protein HJG54_18135 [Leptolyngbya sp. NK1-12]
MDEAVGLDSTKFKADLEAIATLVQMVAQQHQGQSTELLAILRLLEQLHQEIRDSLFQESLPDNRQALYALLRDIETSGGWPYIHRMKLQAFLSYLSEQSAVESPAVESD